MTASQTDVSGAGQRSIADGNNENKTQINKRVAYISLSNPEALLDKSTRSWLHQDFVISLLLWRL